MGARRPSMIGLLAGLVMALTSGAPLRAEVKNPQPGQESSCLSLMTVLHSFLADENGTPLHSNLSAYPTSVFCVPDYDMVNNRIRKDIKRSSYSQSLHFLFDWSLVIRRLPQSDAFLRVYMQSFDELLPRNSSTVPVRVSIKLVVAKSISTIKSSTNDKIPHWMYLRSIDVGRNSSGWLKFNVNELLQDYWDPLSEQAIIVVTLKFDVHSEQKLPLQIFNPATLGFKALRQELSVFQPVLVISTDDKHIKRAIYSLEELVMPKYLPRQRKRSAANIIMCHVEDFFLTFSDLGIKHILRPITINIKHCMGSCSINFAPRTMSQTTNHARLMTSAVSVYNTGEGSSLNIFPPEEPCCSPIKYSPVYVVTGTPSSYSVILESDMVVTECGCR